MADEHKPRQGLSESIRQHFAWTPCTQNRYDSKERDCRVDTLYMPRTARRQGLLDEFCAVLDGLLNGLRVATTPSQSNDHH
jgi:hypothetical protein